MLKRATARMALTGTLKEGFMRERLWMISGVCFGGFGRSLLVVSCGLIMDLQSRTRRSSIPGHRPEETATGRHAADRAVYEADC